MRALVQRVLRAEVSVRGETSGAIGAGLCAFLGATHSDDHRSAERMAAKLWHLRVFEDDAGAMNHSAADLDLPLLVVSQFTLYADTTKGRRPSFVTAAGPEQAAPLVEHVVDCLRRTGATVATGQFRARMAVSLVNDGPVTLLLET